MSRFAAILIAVFLLGTLARSGRAQDAAAPVVGIRFSATPEKVRVVFDLQQAVTYTDHSTATAVCVALPLALAQPVPPAPIADPIVREAAVKDDGAGGAIATVTLAKARKFTIFTLPAAEGKPFRLVVDILKRFTVKETRQLTPAIAYTRFEEQTDDHYLAVHTLVIDAQDPHVQLRVATAKAAKGERVVSMVTRTGAVAGVNGGYFLAGARPVGLVKVDGRVAALPLWGRTALAFPARGNPVLGNPAGTWRVQLPDGNTREALDWLEASVLTDKPAWSLISGATFTAAPANPAGYNVLIRDGKVNRVTKDAVSLDPADAVLYLRAEDDLQKACLAENAAVALAPVVTPDWTAYPFAVGAGPRLLHDGKIEITGEQERFKPDILNGRNARTAVGLTREGRVILLVVEAPCPYGGGATLAEMAQLLLDRGAREALNLDGGGSSNLAIGDTTVNYPPKTWLRPVATGVLVFDDRGGVAAADAAGK